jgi:hypothetical protein
MQKLINYLTSLSLVILLFPMSVIAGEIIEAECSDGGQTVLFLINTDGGKQNIVGGLLDVTFTGSKVILTPNEGEGDEVVIDFNNGNYYKGGEKKADCKFSNLGALGLETTLNAEVEETELQETKAYETICGLDTYYDDMVIRATRINGPISMDDFSKDGNIGVEALVDGNGNQARYSGIVDYEKVGNRLELDSDEISTNVTKEQFQEHFGLFPTVTCTAG